WPSGLWRVSKTDRVAGQRPSVTLAYPAKYPQPISPQQKQAWAKHGVKADWSDPITGIIGGAASRAFNMPLSPGKVRLVPPIREFVEEAQKPPYRAYFDHPSYWRR